MKFIPLSPGQSVLGKKIRAYRSGTGPKYYYLISGVHGDEPEGVALLGRFFSWLKQQKLSLPLIILPKANPDGLKRGTRTNAQGIDLNRNFPTSNWSAHFQKKRYFPGLAPMTAPENIYLKKLFEKYPPLLVVSVHSWKPMLNYNGKLGKNTAEFMSAFNGYRVTNDMGYPTPGSLGHYLPEHFGAAVLTLECPVYRMGRGPREIWQQNASALKEWIKSVDNKR